MSNSQTPFVSETSILFPYSSFLLLIFTSTMAPQNSKNNNLVNSTSSKLHSLKAAIFQTMANKMSQEINQNLITLSTRRAFLKILYAR